MDEDEFRKSVIKHFALADDSFWEALERAIDEYAVLKKTTNSDGSSFCYNLYYFSI